MPYRSNSTRVAAQPGHPVAPGDVAALLARWDPRSEDERKDDLIKAIENDDTEMRFVPDFSGASYKNAA